MAHFWFWILNFFFVLFCQFSLAQKPKKGITIESRYTFDFATNALGGIKSGTAYLGNLDLTVEFNTETLNLWEGGQFFSYLLNNHGNSLSSLIGDYQIANNIEAESHTRLYQFWYKQNFENWSILIGQHDLNSVFAITDTGSNFINSSFGIQPDLSTNFPASIFPLATLGVVLEWNIGKNIKFNNAIYDGDPGTESGNPNSLTFKLSKTDGALIINEIQIYLLNKEVNEGIYKIGLWNHTQNKAINNKGYNSTHGVYFIGDQNIFQNSLKNINVFTQIGVSLSPINPVKSYIGSGLWLQGFNQKRALDGMGIAIAKNNFSEFYKTQFSEKIENEIAIELTYDWVKNEKISIKPNIQYIINPGSSIDIANSLMALIRFDLSW